MCVSVCNFIAHMVVYGNLQCWASYFLKVTSYISYSTIVLYIRDDEGVGVVHEENLPKSSSEILHGHFTVLVRYKQAQICLQNNPKCF